MIGSALGTGFAAKLAEAEQRSGSLLCVGLDPDLSRFPFWLRELDPAEAIVRFNAAIVEATADLVCAYKPNFAFYLQYGLEGIGALLETRRLIPDHIPVLLDCKVGDIDNTAAAYARGIFGAWGFDAITANPYLGEDALAPFLAYEDRAVFVLCKTSNRGSGDLQDLPVAGTTDEHGEPESLFLTLASRASEWQERHPARVGLVVGATYPAQLAAVRARCPALPILLPGVGAQAGDLAASVRAGVDASDRNLLVSSSRGVTYAGIGPDFAERAREAALALREAINDVRRAHRGAPLPTVAIDA
jgi:orotidine-5'-phosphate decarboxylase